MLIRSLLALLFFALVYPASASAQRNHTTKFKSGSAPNAFDVVEKQAGDSAKGPSAAELTAQRKERLAKVSELNRELQDIVRAASDLQERLKAADTNNVVSLELRNQGKLLEEVARKIRKQISSL